MDLKAKPGGCEDASPLSGAFYIPCNKPAVRMIGFGKDGKGEGPYRMCEMCGWHSVKNRNGTDLGIFVE